MGTSSIYREAPHREKSPRKVSIETFLRKYREGAPGVKYEFNNGIIEKSDAMRYSERYIVSNLRKKFESTKAAKAGSTLECEFEVWTSSTQLRKPDLSFSTVEQTRAAMDGFEPLPEFVIEVISPNDKINQVKDKVSEYFNAGVEAIWLIYPQSQMVEVYRKSSQSIEMYHDDQICSAEPVVEGFEMKVSDIFKRP